MEWIRELFHWVEALAETPYGTWALFGVSFAESSFFPVPPDVLLIALCVAQPERALWFALVCSVASVLGGVAGYAIGWVGGRPLLVKLFNSERVEKVGAYYQRYNAWAVGIAGLTPLPYKLFTVSGGALQIGFRVFVLASVASRSLRFFAVALLMRWLGDSAKVFIERHLGWLTIAFVSLLLAGFWLAGRKARVAARA